MLLLPTGCPGYVVLFIRLQKQKYHFSNIVYRSSFARTTLELQFVPINLEKHLNLNDAK